MSNCITVIWLILSELAYRLHAVIPTATHCNFFNTSRVLAHFPPANTYESKADVSDVIDCADFNVNNICNLCITLQMLKTVKLLKDKGRSRHSVLLYGHGDGGGGPT